jgi:hypothetical protein
MDDQFPNESSTEAPDYRLHPRDHRAYRLIFFVLGALEVLLGFRFVLKFLGANPASAFAKGIYGLSALFVKPFGGLFPPATTTAEGIDSVFEPSTVIAMIVYAVLAWGIARLFLIFRSKPKQ